MAAVIKSQRKLPNLNSSLLCVGLDSDYEKLPAHFRQNKQPQFEFNKWIIDQTHQFVCAYKPNLAFYEVRGEQGWHELRLTLDYLGDSYPDILTIADAKLADIGSTNEGYVTAIFDQLGFDAVTLNPYLGKEALRPFLDRSEKTCIILCKTSNQGSGEFQDLRIMSDEPHDSKIFTQQNLTRPLWQVVAQRVSEKWNSRGNCMLVVGATYPQELKQVREVVGDMTILVPGIGAQGGSLEQVLQQGLTPKGQGLIINVGRSVIFAENPGDSSRVWHEQIQGEISSVHSSSS